MATIYEKLRWNLFKIKEKVLMEYGMQNSLITSYDKELINNLHNIYYGGLPISLLILNQRQCLRKCYDKALLLSLGLKDYDYKMIDADVDYIELRPSSCDIAKKTNNKHIGNHCFIEATIKNVKRVIYDTNQGLMYDRNLYYMINSPKITKIHTKEEVENYIEYQEIIEYNKKGIGEDRYFLPTLIELLEININNGCTYLYSELIKEELEKYKEEIGYSSIIEEVKE